MRSFGNTANVPLFCIFHINRAESSVCDEENGHPSGFNKATRKAMERKILKRKNWLILLL